MRNRPFYWLGTFAALVVCLGPARWAQAKIVDEIALVVDQDAMTKGELDESIQELTAEQGLTSVQPGTPDYESAKKTVIDAFIREVLLSEEADRQKIEISDGEIDHQVDQAVENMKKGFASDQDFNDGLKRQGVTLDDLKQELHDKLLRRTKAGRVMHMKQQELPTTALVTDNDVQEYYNQHPTDFEQVKFSMVLFRTEPGLSVEKTKQVEILAQQALKQLKGGANFAQYAKEHSEDKDSAVNGGEIGTLARASFADPRLAKGVFALPVNGMGIVRGESGFYVIHVEYKGTADYAAVAPEIKDHLQRQKQDSALSQWIDTLKKDAYIVVDGKVVPYVPETPSSSGGMTIASSAVSAASVPGTPSPASNGAASTDNSTNSQTDAAEVFSSLPEAGSLAFYFGADGFNYGTQDLAGYYPSGINTNQGFPFGIGLDMGIDLAVDPNFQVGLKGEALRKISENVTDTNGYNDQWISSTIGPSLEAKVLIPLEENANFILSAAGGYYFLVGSGVTISSGSVTENVDFNSATWGLQGGAALEFMLDEHKNTALDIGVGYRYIKFSNISTNVTVNGPIHYSSPLLSADGANASVDFSGVRAGISVRFFLDKSD